MSLCLCAYVRFCLYVSARLCVCVHVCIRMCGLCACEHARVRPTHPETGKRTGEEVRIPPTDPRTMPGVVLRIWDVNPISQNGYEVLSESSRLWV